MVKRYYDTSISWLLKKESLYLILFIVGVIAGSMYGIHLKGDTELFYVVNQYIKFSDGTTIHLNRLMESLTVYGRNVIFLWLGGLSPFLMPISLVIFFFCIFSYGFTITCFLLLYGLKGLLIGLVIFGLQAASFVLLAIWLGNQGMRYSFLNKGMHLTTYLRGLVIGLLGIVLIAGTDAYLQPIIEKMILYWGV